MQTYIKLKKKMKKAHLIILGTKICHDLIFGLVIIFVEGGRGGWKVQIGVMSWYEDRESFMSCIMCRYVLPCRSECYKLLRLCVCWKGQLGAKISPVLTSGEITGYDKLWKFGGTQWTFAQSFKWSFVVMITLQPQSN